MTHLAKPMWIPSEQAYRLICTQCGVRLADEIETLVMEVEGDCTPDPSLSVNVSETVKTEDIFGEV